MLKILIMSVYQEMSFFFYFELHPVPKINTRKAIKMQMVR